MGSRIHLQLVDVVPSLGGELEYALFCRMRVDSQLHIAEHGNRGVGAGTWIMNDKSLPASHFLCWGGRNKNKFEG